MKNTYNAAKGLIANVYLLYPKIMQPALKYGESEDRNNPLLNKEYVTDVLINRETAKELKKSHKLVKSFASIKELDAEEFEAKYRIKAPYDAEEYFILKVRSDAAYKDGKEKRAPFVTGVAGCPDKICKDTVIGNGTKAHVQINIRDWEFNGRAGQSCDLLAVGVINLVKHVAKGDGIRLAFETNEDIFNVEEEIDDVNNQVDNEDEFNRY